MLRVAVLASGRGSNLASLLRHCAAGHVQARVTLVLSDRPDAGALAVARSHHVPGVVELAPEPGEKRSAYAARLLDILQAERPGLVVLAGYMRIVGTAVLDAFPQRVVNIHPSLLPAFKGRDAVRQAHEAGVARAGCSTHLVTADLDGGPVLLQARVEVRPGESLDALRARILRLEHLLLPRTVQLFAEARIESAGRTARIKPGPSWLDRRDLDLMAGVWYSEGF